MEKTTEKNVMHEIKKYFSIFYFQLFSQIQKFQKFKEYIIIIRKFYGYYIFTCKYKKMLNISARQM